jgi:hypothetical protein
MVTTPLRLPRELARLLHYGETPIDTFDEWCLVLRPEPACGWKRPWSSYRLARPLPVTGRSSFWLASNGERMAVSKDWTQLVGRHPAVAAWAGRVATHHARTINNTAASSHAGACGDAVHWSET